MDRQGQLDTGAVAAVSDEGTKDEGLSCPACGESAVPGAQWCEACGASIDGDLGAVGGPPCIDCGADYSEIVEGYCSVCGRKQPGERDHLRETIPGVAAVTDRGLRHAKNEDAYAIGRAGDALVVVVCDGVSTTTKPEDVSLAAANAARDSIVADLESGDVDVEAILVRGTDAAQAAAVDATDPGESNPGAATYVATVVRPTPEGMAQSWTAWLGDSRAYWLHGESATQLTVDDVWWREQVAEDLLEESDALADARAQSITRWVGADATSTAPRIHFGEHEPGGRLLACSDGLWKYLPKEEDVAGKIVELGLDEPDQLAEELVAFALERGGHDNTTVVVGDLGARS